MITVNSYFSGCGGMDVGLTQAGLHVQQSVELDPQRCKTINHNLGHEALAVDISDKTVFDQPPADVLVGTWPCKKYSTIADISGTRTGDNLFLHFFRHVALAQPEVFVVENVPGMKIFPVVMEALTEIPDYYVQVECPLETTNWLPQKRDRLILIGSRRPMKITSPRRKPIKLEDILEDDPDVEIPDYVYNRLGGKYRDKPIVVERDGVAPTCLAHYSKDLSTRLVKDKRYPHGVRPFSLREWARLQGFPDDYEFTGSTRHSYSAIGDAVPVPMGRWIGRQIKRYFK
jgi:DNA (cytosine-5)-methyltransferase 1